MADGGITGRGGSNGRAGGVGVLRFWLSRTALGGAASKARPVLLAKPAHDPHRSLALLVLVPLAAATIAFGVLALYKHVLGGGTVFQAVEARAEEQGRAGWEAGAEDGSPTSAPAPDPAGAGTAAEVSHAEVSYISEIVGSNGGDGIGIVTTPVVLDDSWFAQGSDAYNHDLARTCVALCAVVNAESAFYGGEDRG